MSARRMQGSTCATLFGVGVITAVFAGCGGPGEADSVVVCGREIGPTTIVRADDGECDRGNPGTGRYVMQLPDTQYEQVEECCDDDGFPYYASYPIYAGTTVGNVGRPLPFARSGDARSGFVRAVPGSTPGTYAGFSRSVTVPPSAAPGAPLGASTISRGGLGVTGGGSKGYGFTGSSGGS